MLAVPLKKLNWDSEVSLGQVYHAVKICRPQKYTFGRENMREIRDFVLLFRVNMIFFRTLRLTN